MTAPTRNVVIVGAGPAGMALAYLLARRGVGVTVLESHHDFARAFRGEGLQQSGIDAFRQMGLGDRLDRIPQACLETMEIYHGGRLRLRTRAVNLGRGGARVVSQPALLGMLAEEAGRYPSFRLELGALVRGFLDENGRVAGVRADTAAGPREYRADLVVGADGRNAVTRKHANFSLQLLPQAFDLLWARLPFPESFTDRTTALFDTSRGLMMIAFPTADGQLQVGFAVPKGTVPELRARGMEAWVEERLGRLPAGLAAHFRAHKEKLTRATLLDVVCGRLSNWTAPGLLLLGDAAHPMSPVGGQGVNLALRDALVAANHLCPVLVAGGDATAIDAAARRVQDERLPEIIAAQQMQQGQARLFVKPLLQRLLPLLLRTGILTRLFHREYELMSRGVVPVRLAV
jgi:2-polyprenyl-6-methoxyphenol hydroxylase-like FAD-dependent oxidoreductase